jgi:hypothetical protein
MTKDEFEKKKQEYLVLIDEYRDKAVLQMTETTNNTEFIAANGAIIFMSKMYNEIKDREYEAG